MFDRNLITTRYRAVAFMSGYLEAYEAMMEHPSLEHVPIKYIKDTKKFFKKAGILVSFVYEIGTDFKKTSKAKAEFFTVSASKKEKPIERFITI